MYRVAQSWRRSNSGIAALHALENATRYDYSPPESLRRPSRVVSCSLSQNIFDFGEQRASAKCLWEREKLLDCAMIFQPLIFDKTPYDEN